MATLAKPEIEARLEALGAFWLADMDDLHELWGTPWGFEVWVPMAGPSGRLDEAILAEVEEDIRDSKP